MHSHEIGEKVMVREASNKDLDEILKLYLYLHEDSIPELDAHLEQTWERIICDPNHHLVVNEVAGKIVSSCVCVIIPKTNISTNSLNNTHRNLHIHLFS